MVSVWSEFMISWIVAESCGGTRLFNPWRPRSQAVEEHQRGRGQGSDIDHKATAPSLGTSRSALALIASQVAPKSIKSTVKLTYHNRSSSCGWRMSI